MTKEHVLEIILRELVCADYYASKHKVAYQIYKRLTAEGIIDVSKAQTTK